ncbi:MAG: hypothetical protein H3C26_02265 [Rhodocyclaceae bacterium]|nr:hypothetical protein [Rhodocyclaceae bacterium]
MLRATLQLIRDIGHDLGEAVRWFFSPDAWRIILIVLVNIGMLAALGYVAIDNYGYSREVFARCPTSKNLVFISEFFAFTFFALFSLAAVGEMVNWVDAKRRGEKPGRLTVFFAYGTLAAVCGTTALALLIRCS